ncbi:TetR/AcrR family transcriptional regulator C-terminal domain-containing protein [Phaeovulum sp. W22_SRMD_FR3]|uniref:TetR/AcrR family transcriptional regulator C-terminal domain-containing protein n=1 Tax=Phaeovulum sp. W22_SRMD_FR3 TaxID=3240274 RepID=UPI003F949936
MTIKDATMAACPDAAGMGRGKTAGAAEASAGRCPAGEDPTKRQQIMAGAEKVFTTLGFDGASMSDISREAGVSKGTLYVYFQGKEDLFAALIEQEREDLLRGTADLLKGEGAVADKLLRYGQRLAGILCSDKVIRAHRIVLGICERMPEMGVNFYEGGANRGIGALQAYLEREVAAGTLVIADTRRAAAQFIDLCNSGLFKSRLFGARSEAPTAEECAHVVGSAVEMFMSYYGRRPG